MIRRLAKDLDIKNAEIFAEMKPHCKRVLKGKHLALLHRLHRLIDHEDQDIVFQLSEGFPVLGQVQKSNIWKENHINNSYRYLETDEPPPKRQKFDMQKPLEWADKDILTKMWENIKPFIADGTFREIPVKDALYPIAMGFPVCQGNVRYAWSDELQEFVKHFDKIRSCFDFRYANLF